MSMSIEVLASMSTEKHTTCETTNIAPTYFDCNATTPLEPEVRAEMWRFFEEEFGNSGSRTHEFGTRAKVAVEKARDQIAAIVKAARDEIIFTSGATESNNLAILGLVPFGEKSNRRHILSTQIEHKAVLEPLEELAKRGFDVELLPPNSGGWIQPDAIATALRPETLLVSVMHANNETGVVQPIEEIADVLKGHTAYFHIDAAQTFGKLIDSLRNPRIDMVSISGHKIYAPKGIGALLARRRGFERIPLQALMFGGGQERGLRPGTLPVPLIVGFGQAADLALKQSKVRSKRCQQIRSQIEAALLPLQLQRHGDPARTLPHVLNFSLPHLDSEAVMLALKSHIAFSNGSACTSASYKPSHVLKAMGLPDDEIMGAVRLSWCHMTPDVDWKKIASILTGLK